MTSQFDDCVTRLKGGLYELAEWQAVPLLGELMLETQLQVDEAVQDTAATALAPFVSTYDRLPYTSYPFEQTHPGALAALAGLFGLTAPPVRTARILELGCAAGGNLIPLAAEFPESVCVGIDLSPVQIEDGQQRIAYSGLRNVRLECRDLLELPGTLGLFDYIICHGVYSWVPPAVRAAIMQICQQHLAPDGIAHVSYNVLPGWRQRQAIRDALLWHVSADAEPAQQLEQLRAMLSFLRTHASSDSKYGSAVCAIIDDLTQRSDPYLMHEYLAATNAPCLFSEFVQAAKGLAFLCEARLTTMLPELSAPERAAAIRAWTGDRLLANEQVNDLVSGRPFRESLLVHDHWAIDRTLRAMHMDKMHVVLCESYRFELENNAWVLHAPQGQYRTSDPIVQAALNMLISRYPASSTLDELSAAAVESGISEPVRAAIRDALFYLVVGGLAIARTEPVCAQPASTLECAVLEDKLDATFCCASALARSDAAAGARATANLLHRPVQLTAIDILLLPRLTGDMSIAALLTALSGAVTEELLKFAEHGDVSLRELLIARLRHYARAALLVAQAKDEPGGNRQDAEHDQVQAMTLSGKVSSTAGQSINEAIVSFSPPEN